MASIATCILFAIFSLNVIFGAMGRSQFLGDVQEMLMLVATSVAFVVLIIQREAARKKQKNDQS